MLPVISGVYSAKSLITQPKTKKESKVKEVAIIANGVATVPLEVAREYDSFVAPFHIKMDGKDYLETEIDRNQLYSRLRGKENLPTTSPPLSWRIPRVM
jgi:fatty acid-binding protein DegV